MPAVRHATASLKLCFSLLFLLSALHTVTLAQTTLNDIHITPIERTPAMAAVAGPNALVGGSFLHVIKKDVNLVLVPVVVTDPQQRLVTGLSAQNFEIFEGKKPQEIQHFSSEDAPVSIGIVLDASGSMSDKMNRVREG